MAEASSTKSVLVTKFGDYSALSVENYPLPPADGLVEVKVEFGGVNFYDVYTRQGLETRKPPLVGGIECSGTIVSLGTNVDTDFKVGDRVICYNFHGGLHREIVRITPEKCYKLPDAVTFETGAAIFVNYLTAYFALFHEGNLKEGENILILSCAGGVGCAAVQLARTVRDVAIFGTTSPAKSERTTECGVSQAFDLKSATFQKDLQQNCPQGFDLIVCNETGANFTFLQTQLKPLGRIILLGANNFLKNDRKITLWNYFTGVLNAKNITLESLLMNNRMVGGLHLGLLCEKCPEKVRTCLQKIFDLLKSKKIEPIIDSVHDMDQVVDAHKKLGMRENVGKVLLKINTTTDTS